jgi:RNA polymerase sigma-70 factor (ECF subfamily)
MIAESKSRRIDDDVQRLLSEGRRDEAATHVLRQLGPEVYGFLVAAMGGQGDAGEVFSLLSERVWKSIGEFRFQCSLRTWVYVIARNEMSRFARGSRRHAVGRESPSAIAEVAAAVRTATDSALKPGKVNKLSMLREELSMDDRTLLILRIDRALPWEDIALATLEADGAEVASEDALKREAARLRKRFQLIKHKLRRRFQQEGILG